MTASGIPNLTTPITHTSQTNVGPGEERDDMVGTTPKKKNDLKGDRDAGDIGEKGDGEGEGGEGGIKFETTASGLPPGVAPGGGRIYA